MEIVWNEEKLMEIDKEWMKGEGGWIEMETEGK